MSERHQYINNLPSRMNKDEFVSCFGGVYEHSPWIAEMAWEKNLTKKATPDQDTAEKTHQMLSAVVNEASKEDKLALLRAHPDLADRLAITKNMTKASLSEQASADLTNCSPQEFKTFQTLNDQYKEKFGFPFIMAVRGYNRGEILENFKKRRHNDTDTEFATALEQVHLIAYLRLKEII